LLNNRILARYGEKYDGKNVYAALKEPGYGIDPVLLLTSSACGIEYMASNSSCGIDDFDGDGKNNADEFALGTSPVEPDAIKFCLYAYQSGDGNVSASVGPEKQAFGTQVALSAEPTDGAIFDQWEGDISDAQKTNTDVTVTLDGHKAVRAVFRQPMQIIPSIIGQGTVTMDPPGPDYLEGQEIILTAAAPMNWRFDHWEGSCSGSDPSTMLKLHKGTSVRAVFAPTAHMLTVAAPAGSPGIIINGAGPYTNGATVQVPAEQIVTLSGISNSQWEFQGWEGPTKSNNETVTFLPAGDEMIEAKGSDLEVIEFHYQDFSVSGRWSISETKLFFSCWSGEAWQHEEGYSILITRNQPLTVIAMKVPLKWVLWEDLARNPPAGLEYFNGVIFSVGEPMEAWTTSTSFILEPGNPERSHIDYYPVAITDDIIGTAASVPADGYYVKCAQTTQPNFAQHPFVVNASPDSPIRNTFRAMCEGVWPPSDAVGNYLYTFENTFLVLNVCPETNSFPYSNYGGWYSGTNFLTTSRTYSVPVTSALAGSAFQAKFNQHTVKTEFEFRGDEKFLDFLNSGNFPVTFSSSYRVGEPIFEDGNETAIYLENRLVTLTFLPAVLGDYLFCKWQKYDAATGFPVGSGSTSTSLSFSSDRDYIIKITLSDKVKAVLCSYKSKWYSDGPDDSQDTYPAPYSSGPWFAGGVDDWGDPTASPREREEQRLAHPTLLPYPRGAQVFYRRVAAKDTTDCLEIGKHEFNLPPAEAESYDLTYRLSVELSESGCLDKDYPNSDWIPDPSNPDPVHITPVTTDNFHSRFDVEISGFDWPGMYKFRFDLDTTTNRPEQECLVNIVLPHAGPDVTDWLENELRLMCAVNGTADAWLQMVSSLTGNKWYNKVIHLPFFGDRINNFALRQQAMCIVAKDFDYTGHVAKFDDKQHEGTPRYCFENDDRVSADTGEYGPHQEPDYTSIKSVVVHRRQITNIMLGAFFRATGHFWTEFMAATELFDLHGDSWWKPWPFDGHFTSSHQLIAQDMGWDACGAIRDDGQNAQWVLDNIFSLDRVGCLQTDVDDDVNDVNLFPYPNVVCALFSTVPWDDDYHRDTPSHYSRPLLFLPVLEELQ